MVYVGIVSFNTLSDLPDCIAAVKRQSHKDIRIIVFDNNSSDGSIAWLRKQRGITLMENSENIGFGRAHNAIINSVRLGRNDYYLALNPDVRLGRRYVSELIAICRTKKADWATGKLYKDAARKVLYSVGHGLLRDGYAVNIGYDMPDAAYWNQAREVFGAPGASPLYSAKLMKTVSDRGNFFDPHMFMYYEDVDVDWRARLFGFRCWYNPRAVAYHPGGGFRKALEIEALANRYRSVMKNASVFDLLTYNLPHILLHILFRIIVSPSKGLRLAEKLIAAFPVVFRRSRRVITGSAIRQWFLWSTRQPTGQPTTVRSRLESFCMR